MRRDRVHQQPHEEAVLRKAISARAAAPFAPSIVQLQRYVGNSGVQRLLHQAVQRDTDDFMGGMFDNLLRPFKRNGVPTGFGGFSPEPGQQGIGEGPPTGFGDFGPAPGQGGLLGGSGESSGPVNEDTEHPAAGDGSVKPGGNEWFEGGGW